MSTEISVDELAQVIRQADGQHSLGAGALAEAILAKLPHLAARQPVGEPVVYQVRPRSFNDGEGWRNVTKREYDDRGPFPGYDESEWERRTLYAAPTAQAVGLGARPMETAPRDGTMVRLLVLFEEHATEDTAEPAWTIGACNDDNVGEDERIGWQFAGWCWTHDHFTECKGAPVGWLPLIDGKAAGNK